MQSFLQTGQIYISGRFHESVRVLDVDIEVKLCIASLEFLRSKGLGDWNSSRISGAFLCISLYNCFSMCEVVVVRYFSLSGLIEYDKTSSIISVQNVTPNQLKA